METLEPARELLSSMDGVSLEALDELETTLTALAALAPAPPTLAVDLTVVRGLDYYTGMVFEVKVEELGGEGQVLGGGSYKLLHLFGLPDLDPCCGFGLGFDRVLLALEAQASTAGREEAVPGEVDGRPHIAIAPNKADHMPLLPLVSSLREAGARVELLLSKKNYGRIIKWTEGIGASHLLVVKPEDLETGVARLINFKPAIARTFNSTHRPCLMRFEAILKQTARGDACPA